MQICLRPSCRSRTSPALSIDLELIGSHAPGDDGFAQTPRCLDAHSFATGVERIAGEQDSRHFGVNETLHDHGHGQATLVHTLLLPIGDGALRMQRRQQRSTPCRNASSPSTPRIVSC